MLGLALQSDNNKYVHIYRRSRDRDNYVLNKVSYSALCFLFLNHSHSTQGNFKEAYVWR